MPKLWDDSLAAHRTAVRESITGTTWVLVNEVGLANVSMSQIAQRVGISRATLYRYFPDVDAILACWHVQQVERHLAQLRQVASGDGTPYERLAMVLAQFAAIASLVPHGTDLALLLHRGPHVTEAQQGVLDLLVEIIAATADVGMARQDIAPEHLARYCVHALAPARSMTPSQQTDLVSVVLAGLRP